jgi:hypothetical protein
LLAIPNETVRNEYFDYRDKCNSNSNSNDESEDNKRLHLTEIFKDSEKISLTNTQGLIFRTGDRNVCAVHSEPNITEPRMFLSILLGKEHQVDAFHSRHPNK